MSASCGRGPGAAAMQSHKPQNRCPQLRRRGARRRRSRVSFEGSRERRSAAGAARSQSRWGRGGVRRASCGVAGACCQRLPRAAAADAVIRAQKLRHSARRRENALCPVPQLRAHSASRPVEAKTTNNKKPPGRADHNRHRGRRRAGGGAAAAQGAANDEKGGSCCTAEGDARGTDCTRGRRQPALAADALRQREQDQEQADMMQRELRLCRAQVAALRQEAEQLRNRYVRCTSSVVEVRAS